MCSAKFELAKSLITQKLLKEILWELLYIMYPIRWTRQEEGIA